MKLHFLGANRQVTGSRYVLEAGGSRVMVDCGMFQERKFQSRNWDPCPVQHDEVDAILLTHVHIDHSGLLPRFVREGYRGPICCTPPSADLAEVMLRDAAKIQAEDAKYKKRRHQKEGRKGKWPEQALYTSSDVEKTLALLERREYNVLQRVSDSMEVKFHEAGHILGSAMLEVIATEGNKKRRVLFSGDIGQWEKPILRPPTLFDSADYVVMESTYGDRNHKEGGDIGEQLKTIINNTMSRGGNVVIPTFAVERAQELMYFISQLVHDDAISDMPIFLDSPMAVDVTEIFRKHRQYFSEEAWQRAISDEPPLRFPGLTMCRSVEESRKINGINTPCIIMSTSGMCHAGRIKHHLRHNLGRPENCILFVGYQGKGTLGRQILDGNHFVRIHGRDWPVKAEITQIYGFSGHADQGDLLRWIGNLQQPPRQVFLTHGEEKSALAFEKELRRLNLPVSVPDYLDVVGLD